MGKKTASRDLKRFVAFTTKTYLEDHDWDIAIDRCMHRGLPVAYAIHDRDVYLDPDKLPPGKNLGDKEKPHCQTLIRLTNGQTVSAFSKNCGVKESHIQGLDSWRDFAVYLLHRDEDSIRVGKYQYAYDALHGNYRNECIEVITNRKSNNFNRSREEESRIVDIVNYIESFSCSISTATLVRWASQQGLYSVYRRSAGIVQNVLREHNQSCQMTLQESIWQLKLKDMEKRLSAAESEIERAYSDLYHRVSNPFNGKCVAEKGISEISIRDMKRGIDEILKSGT